MKYLVDTHLLLWASTNGLSPGASTIIDNPDHELYFSAAAIWEVTIKASLGRPDFSIDPHVFRRALLDHGYIELPITSEHAAAVINLEKHHDDPFDRIQIAQATVEGIPLLTHDAKIKAYVNSPIHFV